MDTPTFPQFISTLSELFGFRIISHNDSEAVLQHGGHRITITPTDLRPLYDLIDQETIRIVLPPVSTEHSLLPETYANWKQHIEQCIQYIKAYSHINVFDSCRSLFTGDVQIDVTTKQLIIILKDEYDIVHYYRSDIEYAMM